MSADLPEGSVVEGDDIPGDVGAELLDGLGGGVAVELGASSAPPPSQAASIDSQTDSSAT